jgi:ABC-type molybdate transport system substrate-binding protein
LAECALALYCREQDQPQAPTMKPFARLLSLLFACAFPAFSGITRADEPEKPALLVFAAASLTNVLGELAPAWEKTSGIPMRLVLIAPANSTIQLRISQGFKLAEALGGGRLATGDPDTVPVGRYARSALMKLGVWGEVEGHLVRADNVRGAMTFVARGEAPLGIVYATDAQIDPKVRVVATFPDNSHSPITYPAAATVTAGPGAAEFVVFLRSSKATPLWKKHGFLELAK